MIVKDMPFGEYLKIDAINASTLKKEPERLCEPVSDQTKKGQSALRFGTAAHLALLEPNLTLKDDRVLSAGEFRTKERKELKAAHIEKYGLDWLYYEEAETIKGMGKAIRETQDPNINAFLKALEADQCETEITVISDMPDSKLKAKVRFDALIRVAAYGLDYKSCQCAEPGKFIKDAINLGYHIQAAWYCDTYFWETGEQLDKFAFLAQEKTGLHLCNLIEFSIDSDFIRIGREAYQEALTRYLEFKESGIGKYGRTHDGDMFLPGWFGKV